MLLNEETEKNALWVNERLFAERWGVMVFISEANSVLKRGLETLFCCFFWEICKLREILGEAR